MCCVLRAVRGHMSCASMSGECLVYGVSCGVWCVVRCALCGERLMEAHECLVSVLCMVPCEEVSCLVWWVVRCLVYGGL